MANFFNKLFSTLLGFEFLAFPYVPWHHLYLCYLSLILLIKSIIILNLRNS